MKKRHPELPVGVQYVRGMCGPYYKANICRQGKRIHLYAGRDLAAAVRARRQAEEGGHDAA